MKLFPSVLLASLALTFVMTASSQSIAGTYQDGVAAEEHIVGDSLFFLSAEFPNVGKILGSDSSGAPTHGCSGTVIGPSSVLTAAHCVDVSGLAALDFTIPAGTTFSSTDWVTHPKWKNNLGRGSDIAVINFADNSFDTVAQSPLYTLGDELGQTGISLGYGQSGTGSTGAMGTFNDFLTSPLQAGENSIDELGSWVKGWSNDILLSDFDQAGDPSESTFGSDEPLPFEYLIASGDSGGPLMIADESGSFSVAGVHSFVAASDGNPDSSYGDISGHTRVSAFASWLDGQLSGSSDGDGGGSGKGGGKGGGNGGGGRGKPKLIASNFQVSATAVTAAVPEPTSLSLGLLGLGILYICRRRS